MGYACELGLWVRNVSVQPTSSSVDVSTGLLAALAMAFIAGTKSP